MPDDGLWGYEEVAAFFGVSVRTAQRMRLPRVPIEIEPGKRPLIRFDPAEIRALVDVAKKKHRGNTIASKLSAVR